MWRLHMIESSRIVSKWTMWGVCFHNCYFQGQEWTLNFSLRPTWTRSSWSEQTKMEISKLQLFITIVWSDRKFKNNCINLEVACLVISGSWLLVWYVHWVKVSVCNSIIRMNVGKVHSFLRFFMSQLHAQKNNWLGIGKYHGCAMRPSPSLLLIQACGWFL